MPPRHGLAERNDAQGHPAKTDPPARAAAISRAVARVRKATTEALPILAKMKARFEEVRPTLRSMAKLAEAIDYVLNRWDAFVRDTEDGRIPIDNNVIERLLRPVAIGRKNFLFVGSEKGGKTAATLYTLVRRARRNCVDVWPYLTDVLRRIAAIAPGDTSALEALLPDRWLAAHPEHRLEQREENSAKPRLVATANGPLVGLPSPSRRW